MPDARGVHNTFFTLNPAFLASRVADVLRIRTRFRDRGRRADPRRRYDSPDKLVGGSPYEKIFQDQDTVIVLYDIPAGRPIPAYQRLLLERSCRRVVKTHPAGSSPEEGMR